MVPVFSAVVGALLGGLVAHLLTLRREIASIRRSHRTGYLVDAYRCLVDAADRGHRITDAQRSAVEAALADIVLLGDSAEYTAATSFMADFASHGDAELRPVLLALRASLRAELRLPEMPLSKTYNLRFDCSG